MWRWQHQHSYDIESSGEENGAKKNKV